MATFTKRTVRAVLLHIGNTFELIIPVAYSVLRKESYVNFKSVMDNIKYTEHK